jgi:hypothetical protein
MVEKLKDKIEGKGYEELRETIRRERQGVTGTILEEVIKFARQAAFSRHLCVPKVRRSLCRHPKLHERTLENLHGEADVGTLFIKHSQA